MKILGQQIKDIGEDYVKFLQNEGVFTDLIQYLFKEEAAAVSDSDSKNLVMPLKWLEAKIQRIRKIAIESTKSLNFMEKENEISVMYLDEEFVLLKRTDKAANRVVNTKLYISKAFNIQKLVSRTVYEC